MEKPLPGEYNPYFQGYIDMVPEGDFMELTTRNTNEAISYFENIPADKLSYKYAEDKWTIPQVLMHINDVERVMAYRALVAARGDNTTPLHSMDDHLYMANSNVAHRTMADLIEEFKVIRAATVHLFSHITDEQSIFPADAVSYTVTARALGYIIPGHVWHHMKVVDKSYFP